MSAKSFQLLRIAAIIVIAIVVGVSVSAGNLIVPIITIAIGVTGLMFAYRRVDAVIVDERSYRMGERASRRAVTVFGLAVAFLTPFLIVIGQRQSPTLYLVGATLGFSGAVLMLLYTGFYYYLSHISMGNDHEE